MKKTIIYSLILLAACTYSANAQNNPNAEKIISKFINLAKSTVIRTNFNLQTAEKNGTNTGRITGNFISKGSKFGLNINGLKVYYNGKTQWSYNEQSNELTITEPSEKELTETNPMTILTAYKSKCKFIFASKPKSTQYYSIEMIPLNKDKEIAKIEVQINKKNENLFSIKTTSNNGSTSLITLNNLTIGGNAAESDFTFNQSLHKKVEINDLR